MDWGLSWANNHKAATVQSTDSYELVEEGLSDSKLAQSSDIDGL